ncbi:MULTISPECIES: replication initiation protein [unclassified Butyrivibrio]|uniref:replication initiation protein n=1 Tax=unclassified Butyrivibrio TaxID=2639466 RepID=UPI000886811C|nr:MULTISPECIES: replication initiation protein [unclassified Butyrivibrio]SDB27343.1 Protein involved in initiation of plasmid replication [Butyrivibrio sp. INlla16]SEM05295.1 Protein involved in initiation of plasmid replication [Butyrivibrio sp. ob235]
MGRKSKQQMEEETTAIESFLSNQHYKKANTLINSKGRSTLLVQKLFAVSIAKAELNQDSNTLEANIYGTDLKKIFGVKGGSFYEHIKAAIEPVKSKPSILDWRIIYSNDDTREIEAINVITDASFKNGVLNVRYNSKITPYLANLQNNYTVLSLAEAVQLNSVYSFRLYEILKAEMDKQRAITRKEGPYYVQYHLTDLKLRLGIIDSQADPAIISALKKGNPDYDAIEKQADKLDGAGKLKTFGNFKKFALDKAQKELNETTSIWFDYEPVKAGRGGKVVSIRFKIDVNPRVKNKNNACDDLNQKETTINPARELELMDQVQDIIDEKIKISEIRSILKASNYNLDKIKNAYDLYLRQSGNVENFVGWMIAAIKNNYTSAGVKASPIVGEYVQSTFSYEDMESELLDNF